MNFEIIWNSMSHKLCMSTAFSTTAGQSFTSNRSLLPSELCHFCWNHLFSWFLFRNLIVTYNSNKYISFSDNMHFTMDVAKIYWTGKEQVIQVKHFLSIEILHTQFIRVNTWILVFGSFSYYIEKISLHVHLYEDLRVCPVFCHCISCCSFFLCLYWAVICTQWTISLCFRWFDNYCLSEWRSKRKCE